MSDINEEQKRLYKRAEENDIKLLQDRINKAIEYIEENKQLSRFADLRKDGVHNYDLECDADDLLDILKGDNK